jgi:hypothetical protein
MKTPNLEGLILVLLFTTFSQATDLKIAFTKSGYKYWVGYDAISGGNEDCYIRYLNSEGLQQWKQYLEVSTDVKCRGVWIELDRNEYPVVVFSIDNDASDNDLITKYKAEPDAFTDSIFPTYGIGQGVTETLVARINPSTRKIEKATFLRAQTANGVNNAMVPKSISYCDTHTLIVHVSSKAYPPAAGSTEANFIPIRGIGSSTTNKEFSTYFRISESMNQLIESTITKELTCFAGFNQLQLVMLFVVLYLIFWA